MDNRKAIVLIHGFGGGARDWRALKRFLITNERGADLFEFSYKERFGGISLAENADLLADYLRENLGERKFSIVGFSQGGLIARSLAMRHGELVLSIREIITVCTPHRGSLVAYAAFGKGLRDLRPGSSFLKGLSAHDDGIPYYCVYNPLDLTVLPGTNARLPRATHTKSVIAPSHFLTFGSKKTLEFIDAMLFP